MLISKFQLPTDPPKDVVAFIKKLSLDGQAQLEKLERLECLARVTRDPAVIRQVHQQTEVAKQLADYLGELIDGYKARLKLLKDIYFDDPALSHLSLDERIKIADRWLKPQWFDERQN